jgi:hypothetical protein
MQTRLRICRFFLIFSAVAAGATVHAQPSPEPTLPGLKPVNEILHARCVPLFISTGMPSRRDSITAGPGVNRAPFETLARVGLLQFVSKDGAVDVYAVTDAGRAALKPNALGPEAQFCAGWWEATSASDMHFVRASWLGRLDVQLDFRAQMLRIDQAANTKPSLPVPPAPMP